MHVRVVYVVLGFGGPCKHDVYSMPGKYAVVVNTILCGELLFE